MDPDHIFFFGDCVFALAIPLVISAFSSSNATMRPAVGASLIGGSMIVYALMVSPGSGYSLEDLPRIAMDLLGM